LNRTGTVYKGHFDIWLINHLQLQLEATRYLIPEPQTLTGWINGDLYVPAGGGKNLMFCLIRKFQGWGSSSLTKNFDVAARTTFSTFCVESEMTFFSHGDLVFRQ